MALVSKILVPVVFSARCQDAARYAAALATRFNSEVTLVHVFLQPWAAFSSPEGYATPPPYDLKSTWEQVKAELAAFLPDACEHLTVHREILEGDPAQAIARFACAGKFDLVVMPTHGWGTFRRFLLGSVTAKVLHDVRCPVFTGPHMEHPPALESPCFRRVLCAIDLNQGSREILCWAARFAGEFGADVALVHALGVPPSRLDGIYFDPEWTADLTASTRAQLTGLCEEMHVPAQILVEPGDAAASVRVAAESTKADVVVIGRGHPHSALGRLRANAYAIIRESPCPVIAV